MKNLIKIVLAILLFLCLFKMPYGYYQIVRFVAMIGFAYLAYSANDQNNKNEIFIYITLAILFQPFAKISFDREIWYFIDVIISIGLLASIFTNKNKK